MTSVCAERSPTRICVFTSTTTGPFPLHIHAARDLAQTFHEHSIQLVYGGGTTGLMGELAATLVNLSGKDSVQGVIPASIITLERPDGAASAEKDSKDKLRKRWTGPVNFVSRLQKPSATSSSPAKSALLSEEKYGMTTVVPSFSARKQLTCTLTSSDAPGSGFVALSGGFRTMDELMEMITLRQQGVHRCRISLYNVDGFWDRILAWMESAIQRGFIREKVRDWVGEARTGEERVKWLAEGKGFRGYEVLI